MSAIKSTFQIAPNCCSATSALPATAYCFMILKILNIPQPVPVLHANTPAVSGYCFMIDQQQGYVSRM